MGLRIAKFEFTLVICEGINLIEKMFAPGDFTFIRDEIDKRLLTNMYRAVEREKLWDFLKVGPSGGAFMFSEEASERLSEVSKAVEDDGHSGASFACTLRDIQYIARHGWDAYVKLWEDANKERDALNIVRLEALSNNDNIIKKAIKGGNSIAIAEAYQYTSVINDMIKKYPKEPERWFRAQISSQYDSKE